MTSPTVVRERVRISTASIVRAVVMSAVALAVFAAVARASRVLEWVVAAAVIAGLLEPAVAFLARRLRRAVALALVALAVIAITAVVAYRVVDGIRTGADALEATVVRQAESLERSERFGEFAVEADLVERSQQLVEQLPLVLFGEESPAGAVRAAVDRAVSILVVVVLTLFLLARAPDLSKAARQLPIASARRAALGEAVAVARHRGLGYVRRIMVLAVAAGTLAFALSHAAGVQGAAALGVWAALWNLVPVVGSIVAFAPVVALAAVDSIPIALGLVPAIAAYEVLEVLLRRRWVVPETMRLGAFLTAVALVGGLEIAGVFGALVALALMAFGVALVEEAVPAWQATTPGDSGGEDATERS